MPRALILKLSAVTEISSGASTIDTNIPSPLGAVAIWILANVPWLGGWIRGSGSN